jgi:PhnB protein
MRRGPSNITNALLPQRCCIHVQLKIGDSIVMVSDWRVQHTETNLGSPQALGGTSVILEMYVDDVDATFKKAVDAGGAAKMQPADAFFGDRYGWVMDPFGHLWALATKKEELTTEQIKQRMDASYAQYQAGRTKG